MEKTTAKAIASVLMHRAWLKVSRNILMPHFGIETKTYREWHDRRAANLQKALDREHNPATSIIPVI